LVQQFGKVEAPISRGSQKGNQTQDHTKRPPNTARHGNGSHFSDRHSPLALSDEGNRNGPHDNQKRISFHLWTISTRETSSRKSFNCDRRSTSNLKIFPAFQKVIDFRADCGTVL
jgi:hypothetical protein